MANGRQSGRGTQDRTVVLEQDESTQDVHHAGALEQLARGEIDIQIATARRFPRSIEVFQKKALSMATIDEETAASCFYVLPKRKGSEKAIEGPSARLAEIVASAWGHMAIAGRIVEEGDRFIVAQGAAWDLENNVRRAVEVRRRITTRDGGRFSDDMIAVTCNAAIAIATRNAVFQIVPQAYTRQIYHECRAVAVGTARDARREARARCSSTSRSSASSQAACSRCSRSAASTTSRSSTSPCCAAWRRPSRKATRRSTRRSRRRAPRTGRSGRRGDGAACRTRRGRRSVALFDSSR
jgi:hypothetical protein